MQGSILLPLIPPPPERRFEFIFSEGNARGEEQYSGGGNYAGVASSRRGTLFSLT